MPSAPLTCASTAVPRRLVGDTFLSLSLLLNESPSRSASSSFASRAAPNRPAASMSSLLHLIVAQTITLCACTIDLSLDAMSWPPVLDEISS